MLSGDVQNLKLVYGKWLSYSKSINETLGEMFLGTELRKLIQRAFDNQDKHIQIEAIGSGVIITHIPYKDKDSILNIKQKLIDKSNDHYDYTNGNPLLIDFYLGHSDVKLSNEDLVTDYTVNNGNYVFTVVLRSNENDYLKKIKIKWENYIAVMNPSDQFVKDIITSCRRGYTSCLKYLETRTNIKNNKIKKENIADYVCLSNNLDLLKYLVKKRDEECTKLGAQYASQRGHIRILKYLYTNNFKLTKRCCELALANGKYDCFEYLIENGCPYDFNACLYSVDYNKRDYVRKVLDKSD